jgi:fluoride ion exporter CrcB/FEX
MRTLLDTRVKAKFERKFLYDSLTANCQAQILMAFVSKSSGTHRVLNFVYMTTHSSFSMWQYLLAEWYWLQKIQTSLRDSERVVKPCGTIYNSKKKKKRRPRNWGR